MRVYYRVDGPADAPALVLSPSLGTTLELWEPQLRELAAQFRIVRYDPRGHGRSPVPPGPYTLDELGRDVLELLDDLELERSSFCGLSIGGMVGMWLAAEAPDRIDRLVLCCTAPALPPREQWLERAATVRTHGVRAISEAVVARWFTPAAPPELVSRFERMLVSTPAEGYAASCEALAELDLHDRLDAIEAPTLVLTGAEDRVAPPAAGGTLAASIRGARHVTIAGAAHIANAEQPAALTRHVLDHLSGEVR